METLRFAPIIRVSTESQEKQGESLRTQRTQITQYVQSLHGTIPDLCWQYTGQEHATPDQERSILERLLIDSGKDSFDAVIVCDASRWSRDNLKSKEGLNILRKNNIRFFVGTMEYDLFSPEHTFYLGMSAEIGEFQARQQSLKSIMNRIERAKRGIPTAGSLPYGRLFDKKTGQWSVDPIKKKIIEQAANRYLAGEGLRSIADSLNLNLQVVWRVLNRQAGSTITQRFTNKQLNIDESVPISVPRLLEDDTITAIHERAKANKTYHHGQIDGKTKNKYLLSRMIFCARCGNALTGTAKSAGTRPYYRHTFYKDAKCGTKHLVPANLIENSVLLQLAHALGDPIRMQEAVSRATPNDERRLELIDEKKHLSAEIDNISRQRNTVIGKIADELITDEEAKAILDKYRVRQATINDRLATIRTELLNMHDPDRVKQLSSFAGKVLQNALKTGSPQWILKKSDEWKRKLLEMAFSGRDVQGRRMGVYIDETGNAFSPFTFEIRGTLEPTLMRLPLPDEYLVDMFNLDAEYCNVSEELTKIKNNISNFTTY